MLQATARGLGTCWLGGFFNRGGFARVLGLRAEESLPAVIAVGRPAGREGLVDLAFHLATASRSRRPWSALFFDGRADRPLEPEAAGPWREPLEMVRLAPSANNRQPWRVVREGAERFHFCRAGGGGTGRPGDRHVPLRAGRRGAGAGGELAIGCRQPAGREAAAAAGLPLPAGWTWTACWVAGEARP